MRSARLRLLRHGSLPGPRNMGIDDALLHASAAPGDYTVRFYRWIRPTVSLGYGQAWRTGFDARIARRYGMALVRRRTGGRAVLHAGELTYSVVGSTEEGPLAGGIQATYAAIAEGLVAGLAKLGVAAEVVRSRGRRERGEEPGACFASRALNEIVAGGGKLIGSAQRRAGGRALQHGSILLVAPDPDRWAVLGSTGPAAAQESIGLDQLVGRRLGTRTVAGALARGVAERLDARLYVGELTRAEHRAAARYEAMYADAGFTRRR